MFPGAAMLDMALAVCLQGRTPANRHSSQESVVHLEGFSILHPVVVADSRVAGLSYCDIATDINVTIATMGQPYYESVQYRLRVTAIVP